MRPMSALKAKLDRRCSVLQQVAGRGHRPRLLEGVFAGKLDGNVHPRDIGRGRAQPVDDVGLRQGHAPGLDQLGVADGGRVVHQVLDDQVVPVRPGVLEVGHRVDPDREGDLQAAAVSSATTANVGRENASPSAGSRTKRMLSFLGVGGLGRLVGLQLPAVRAAEHPVVVGHPQAQPARGRSPDQAQRQRITKQA